MASAASGTTTRISVDSAGVEANNLSIDPAISSNGRFVAFNSYASNLIVGDTNAADDVFVHDRQTGETTRLSIPNTGLEANDNSWGPAISGDGHFVAFTSAASNLVAGDTNGSTDVFVRDRQTGETTRVSVNSIGLQGESSSSAPAISTDGRVIAFQSFSSNLVGGDTNGGNDIFVHDRQTGATTRVSIDSTGGQAESGSSWPAISGDGRFVAFNSVASNLVVGDTNGANDVFVHDRQTGETTRVSVDNAGLQANSLSSSFAYPTAINSDGRVIVFTSGASNLVAGDTNGTDDIFVHDRQTGETTRVSVGSAGLQANASSRGRPAISGDGRFVAFESVASNLVANDTNGASDVFLRDRQTGETTRVSIDSAGLQTNGHSFGSATNADGRFVAFVSAASNLVAGDTSALLDIFVHERLADTAPPTLALPPTPTIEATGPAGAVAMYTVSATDDKDPNPTVTCSPPSGSIFAIGSTAVLCTAIDAAGNTATGTFVVHVVDTTPPVLSLPGTLRVDATSLSGAVVIYGVAATDLAGPAATTCSHSSGSMFPIGTTTVTCTAIDASGNLASGAFDVVVRSATQQIDNLVTQVKAVNAKQGVADSLDAKLQNVLDALNSAKAGDKASACNKLDSFINEVRAQTGPGKSLTQADGDQLIADAQRIKAVIGC